MNPSGWGGIRTHERLSPLPVFKVGKAPPGTARANTQENEAEALPRASARAPRASGPERETEPNRATTSQIETTHQTSQRQVATTLSRDDSKWRESRGPGRWWNRAPYLIPGGVVGGANMGFTESIL